MYKEYKSEWNYIRFDNSGIYSVTEKIHTLLDNKYRVVECCYIKEAIKINEEKFVDLNDLLIGSKL